MYSPLQKNSRDLKLYSGDGGRRMEVGEEDEGTKTSTAHPPLLTVPRLPTACSPVASQHITMRTYSETPCSLTMTIFQGHRDD
ncbi:hypothetical protein E2C01_061904 [Portunus trituberculatus]|uniref:Uncharacterized protein n=1 Tax=Portunus trituberculatus TaxID=210409 RepID=A0A5B7H9J8_PORTR|nr:hypothetical protein [Portunus trituberculatus]